MSIIMTKKSETQVQAETRLEYSQKHKGVLWRNNVGAFKSANGQWVRYGLANDSKQMNKELKSSDLIGWTPITITTEMVGHTIPVFTSIEVKEEGLCSTAKMNTDHVKAQQKWCDGITKTGGIAGIVDSSDMATVLLIEWLRRFDQRDMLDGSDAKE
jgi:hypothetical protein